MVGIEEVARQAGVSIATVSRALRDLPNVAPTTRSRVRDVADRLGYVPNPHAARLASGRVTTLGVVVPNVDSWFFGEVAEAAHGFMNAAGRDLLLFVVASDEVDQFLDRSDVRKRVAGLLLVNVPLSAPAQRTLQATGLPTVAIGSASGIEPSVRVDEERVGALAVGHLLECGHRRIGIVGDAHGQAAGYRVPTGRRNGAVSALQEAGLEFGDDLFVSGDFTVAGGREAGRALLDRPARPTAVFAMSDEMAIGVIAAARDLGLAVPGDLSVIGVDDHDVSDAVGLTTIRQHVERQGELGSQLLLQLLAVERVGEIDDVLVDVELVVRSTTGPPPP